MRDFHPARFPTSDSTSVLVCKEIPLDIGFHIFSFCGPFDLAKLSCTSKSLRAFIQTNRLWESSYGNMSRGNCSRLPPPPVVEASRNYSPSAYAFWLLGGGLCTRCSAWTDSQPCHFLFRFRACSAECRGMLLHGNSMWHDKRHKYTTLSWGNWLPRESCTLPNGGTVYRYSRRAIKDAENEREQALVVDRGEQLDAECALRALDRSKISQVVVCLDVLLPKLNAPQNAKALESWQIAYLVEKAVVKSANLSFMKSMCMAENKKVQGVLRCPAALSVFDAFNRDLELITTTVWAQIRRLTLAQLEWMKAGVLPPNMPARPGDRIRCEQCNELRADGVSSHKHKATKAPETTRPMLCPECPHSRRSFSEQGLRDHMLSRSVNFPSIVFTADASPGISDLS
ncbi:hypothetical protein FB45DRAFT_900766, partial [Roridomyces roridus]